MAKLKTIKDKPMADDTIEPIVDLAGALRNVVLLLQVDPRQYRHFGAYWWAVKGMLKRHGYTTDHFYGLGQFVDHEALSHVEPGPDALVLARACDFYQYHAVFFHGDPVTYYPDTGEPYTLCDPDVNL